MLDINRIHMIPSEQNVDLMNDVEIYKDFKLVAKCPAVEMFRWTRRFSRPGSFMLTTAFDREIFSKTYAIGNVIYKRDNNEGALITGRRVIATLEGDLRLIVKGEALSSIFNRRVVSLNGDFTLTNLLSNIVNNNFLAAAGTARSMAPLVQLLPIPNFGGSNIPVEYRQRNAQDIMDDLLQENEKGVKVRYNIPNRTLDIDFYAPTESIAVFDKEWGNVLEQDYWDDISGFKNVALVGDNFVFNNHITGFNRREVSTTEPREGATRFEQTARDLLNRNRKVRTISSRVDAGSVQFEYGKDWDIGSIVLSQNRDIGFAEKEVVTEIVEFFDQTGRNIEVNTGDYTERGMF